MMLNMDIVIMMLKNHSPIRLKSEPEFNDWKNGNREDLIPFDKQIPRKPDATYRKSGEWISWPDF